MMTVETNFEALFNQFHFTVILLTFLHNFLFTTNIQHERKFVVRSIFIEQSIHFEFVHVLLKLFPF